MLHKVGRFNDIPKDMLPKIPPAGTITTYQFVEQTYDSATKKHYYRDTLGLPPFSRVWVEGKSGEDGRWIDIGLLGSVDQNGNPVPSTVRHLVFHPHRTGGYLNLTHGKAEDDDLYQFLELCQYVGTNPNRDTTVEVILNKKDFHADAEKDMEKMEKEHEAFGIAYALKGAELTNTALILGIDATMPAVQVRTQVADYAKKNPDTFLALSDDPNKEPKSVLAAGLANGALVLNEDMQAITDANGTILLQLTDTSRSAAMEQWAAKVSGDKAKGANFLKGIKALVDLKDKK